LFRLLAGDTNIGAYGNAWLVKTDSNGKVQWNEIYTEIARMFLEEIEKGWVVLTVLRLSA